MRFFSTLIASTLGTLLALGLTFFLFLLFIFALAASSDVRPQVRAGSVLVLSLEGDIPETVSGDLLSQRLTGESPFGLYDLTRALQKAAADDRIDGIWLQVRSLSASWASLQEVRQALLSYKRSGKPLYATGGELPMTEADYYLASAADSVFAPPEGLFEFNGFVLTSEFYKGLLDKLDIEPQIVRAGMFKGAVEPFLRQDLSPENEEQLTALLTDINNTFLEAVSESRSVPRPTLERHIADQPLFTTRDGLEAGLFDALLFEDEIETLLKARFGVAPEDDLRAVDGAAYVRVPAADAGLATGDEGEVAVVYAVGAIMPGKSGTNPNPMMGGVNLGASDFAEDMREVRERDRVKAVVLRIDSPGGFAPAADAMWREIKRTAAVKPVIVSMGGMAASGGYWIAAAADTIVADPLTLTGSIGVFSLFFDIGGLFENKLGITFDAVRTGPYADMFSGLRPFTERERSLFQASTDNTYQVFLQKVADSRGLSIEAVNEVAQGRVWTGQAALEHGLVDLLGGLGIAIDLAAERGGLEEGTYQLRMLPRPKTFFEELSSSFSAQASQSWWQLRTTPAERALYEQAQVLHRLVNDQGTIQARLPVNVTIH